MLKVVCCLLNAHDPWLVGLAAAICALSAGACIELFRHANKASGRLRVIWLCVAAVAGGTGVWATHFVAMIAYEPGLPNGYLTGLTAISLVYAIVLTGLGLTVALLGGTSFVAFLGGVLLGIGIAAMHYTGMAAFEFAGRIMWDPVFVTISLILGAGLSGAALPVALSANAMAARIGAALLLLLAICGHHFTAMGAVTIVPDPGLLISESALPEWWLALGVALASLTILFLACAALVLDIRERRHAAFERERLHSLANAAVEGLVVCRGDLIVNANDSFGKLVGLSATQMPGMALSRFLPDAATRLALNDQSDHAVEAELSLAAGGTIPVELIVRPVTYGDRPHYAVALRDLRARRRAERQIQFLAHHDALTGLANRANFGKRLEQELKIADATDKKLAVLCLDLDRFKEVNDLFGHAAGDTMLITLARSVTALLDENQMMARLGGDEFAVLLPCKQAVEAGHLAERILETLRRGNDETDGPVIATSLGIALYPDDAQDRTTLLTYADTALYKAKSEGRGTYRFFEAKLGTQLRERRILESDLRHAIPRGQMHLVYQPQTDVQKGATIGFEVLLRWQHPERGAVSPEVFIAIAEESGVILQIGEWVLREACREAASWKNPLSVAVNVSAVQIHAPHFVRLVHEVLFQTGLTPSRLEIEITETALIRDPSRAQSTLRQLKGLGVRIAMDDFGTGYSSLSNLRAYPFDKIKIDGSFIRSVDSSEQTKAIVRSVLGLGRGLGLPVLAEGVETEAELKFLTEEQCDAIQGFFVGRPAPISQFAQDTFGIEPVIERASKVA